ncbi:hypothetical protein Nepgr_009678 [Nepenthes gracilis]|uniref:Transmembrane protein n=1 Tax=Nepenthes gracilis TaxID=150966 RepID=A0AAD3SAY8_NEPGR|nr:hypothetical protein Nepgr_009678 [Nepenthes gracilis]
MAKCFLLFSILTCLLFCLSVTARPGLHFHPCNTVLVSTYSITFRPFNPNFPNHHPRDLHNQRREFFAVVAQSRDSDPKPEEQPLFLEERPRFFFDKTEVDRPNPKFLPFGVSSLHDRTMDILNVVASLLLGAACGALTAGIMYFIWSLFVNRQGDSYRSLDDFSSDDDDDIFNPKKPAGYVAIPAAAAPDSVAASPDSVAAPVPAKETA